MLWNRNGTARLSPATKSSTFFATTKTSGTLLTVPLPVRQKAAREGIVYYKRLAIPLALLRVVLC